MLDTMSSQQTMERSTAYYYGDLERLRKQDGRQNGGQDSEYVEPATVTDDVPTRKIPPLRDRQFSLPEYSTPEGGRKFPGETYSTAGTFPLREKEPLLAELEVVGRLPLTELDGVRRSSSWYLCCPSVDEGDRETAWRCAAWQPVTTPPAASQSTTERADYVSLLKAERDSLSRALSAERARAQSAARAHDSRLAELHAVIAELLRRGRGAGGIREESEEECGSTTQPVEELENDADLSRNDQNDSSSMLSGVADSEPSDEPSRVRLSADITNDSESNQPQAHYQLCMNSARCCQSLRASGARAPEPPMLIPTPGRPEAKVASRVRLRKTEDSSTEDRIPNKWSPETDCLALGVREALAAADLDGETLRSALAISQARCAKLEAEVAVLKSALERAGRDAHRLSTYCTAQESNLTALCSALAAADAALETYDVLLALNETEKGTGDERAAAELVGRQLLARLEAPKQQIGQTLKPQGPWLTHAHSVPPLLPPWAASQEALLRSHAARLKALTHSLRDTKTPVEFFTWHDDEDEINKSTIQTAEMEAAVMYQEVASAVERRAELAAKNKLERPKDFKESLHEVTIEPKNYKEKWLRPRPASETDL